MAAADADSFGFPGTTGGSVDSFDFWRNPMDNLSDGAGNGGFCGKDAWKFSVADSLGDRCGHLVPLVSVGQEEYPDRWIGKGDVACLVCLLPVFSLRVFLIFLLIAFGISLVYWMIALRTSCATIPLVSMLGICYLPVLFFRMYGC